jgi:hypothetical protein
VRGDDREDELRCEFISTRTVYREGILEEDYDDWKDKGIPSI